MRNHTKNDDANLTIKVIGVGGAGINAVNAIISSRLQGVDCLAVASSESALENSSADNKMLITKGLINSLSDSSIENDDAAGSQLTSKLNKFLIETDVLLLVAGMGGTTGSVIAPIIARLANRKETVVMGIVTKPFAREGKIQTVRAQNCVEALKDACDCLVVIPNDQLSKVYQNTSNLFDGFKVSDDILRETILALNEQGREHGDCYADHNIIRSILTKPGITKIALGIAGGENRAFDAANNAMKCALLDGIRIDDATGLIISVTGASNITVSEFEKITNAIIAVADKEATIVKGMAINEALEHQVKVTVIATGLKEPPYNYNAEVKAQNVSFYAQLLQKAKWLYQGGNHESKRAKETPLCCRKW